MPSPLAKLLECVLAISPISSNAFILPKHVFIPRSGQGMFVKEQKKFEDVTRHLKKSGAILLQSKCSRKNPVASEEMTKMNTKESLVHKDESQDESPPLTIDSDEVLSSSQSKSILDDIISKLTSLFPSLYSRLRFLAYRSRRL